MNTFIIVIVSALLLVLNIIYKILRRKRYKKILLELKKMTHEERVDYFKKHSSHYTKINYYFIIPQELYPSEPYDMQTKYYSELFYASMKGTKERKLFF
jgi:hypothetical protein